MEKKKAKLRKRVIAAAACAAVLVLIAARKPFTWLLQSSLKPARRIRQMKTIAAANLFGNGAYIAALLAGLIIKVIAGN